MPVTLDLMITEYRGLQVLKNICSNPRVLKLIRNVIAATDTKVNDHSIEAIRETCNTYGLSFYEKDAYQAPSPATYRLVIGWKWMIPQMENTIVLHDSLLPAYRGFAPLVNALVEGEERIGATAFYASERYDAGSVICQRSMAIIHPIRIRQAIEITGELYVEMVNEILDNLTQGKIPAATPQDEDNASYSLWRDEQDYFINWTDSADRILRSIYALSMPYPGAQSLLNGERIIIDDASLVADVIVVDRQPGKVIFVEENFPVVVCGIGLLKITAAHYYESANSILPLRKFRSRFGS